jgi:6-pyruvoyltetrahydropterin/6-carboxytetrahydropterin synthase
MSSIEAVRYHDFSAGHRVVGHENKCRYLHGHNYRVHFHCRTNKLDTVGRVIDFSVIKSLLCQWLEDNWDHKTLIWVDDTWLKAIMFTDVSKNLASSIVWVPFNPTAENIAVHLVRVVGPLVLRRTNVLLYKVVVEETRKCSAVYTLEAST